MCLGETLQRVDVVAVGEGEEGFSRVGAVGEVGAEQPLDGLRAILALDVAPQLAGDLRIVARAAADEDVEALRPDRPLRSSGTLAPIRPMSPM